MYNIKKARNKVSHGSEDWIVERLLYHILPNILGLFFIKADLAEKNVFSFTHVKRKSSL